MTEPDDTQRDAQLAFLKAKAVDSATAHEDLERALVRAIREEPGTPGREDRVYDSFGAFAAAIFTDGFHAGMVEAAAQVGADVKNIDGTA